MPRQKGLTMSSHSTLSPSSAKRWLECPPSAMLCAGKSDEASPYAMEGTCAHELCEYKLSKALGYTCIDPTDNLDYYDSEMEMHAESYTDFVLAELAKAKDMCKDPEVLIEQPVSFTKWVPGGFGTADCIIASDDTLQIIDFKYGVGVLVDAEWNPQMMLYALGSLEIYDDIYDIKTIKMTIFQPRRDNISTFTIEKSELLKWAHDYLQPQAQLASEGKGEFKAGDHCIFCKVKDVCRKRAEYNLELTKYEFKQASLLEDEEVADVLTKIDNLTSWANDIKDYALKKSLEGVKFPGFKVVEGRSTRKYSNEDLVVEAVVQAGFDPYELKVAGITAMTARLGKEKFNELLGDLIIKPNGKPTLVPESDKRPELGNAKDEFKETKV